MAAKNKAELLLEIDRLKAELTACQSQAEDSIQPQDQNQIPYQAQLLENVSDAVVSTDSEFNILSWNRAAEKLYGWSAQEVIGQGFGEIVPTNYIEVDRADVLDEYHEAGLWQGEVIQQHKNGSDIYVFSSVTTLKGPDGNSLGAIAVNRDITGRKEAEKQYQIFFTENVLSVYWVEFKTPIPIDLPVGEQVDMMFKEGYVKDVSDSCAEIYGLSRKEFIGQSMTAGWAPGFENKDGAVHQYYQEFVRAGYVDYSSEAGPGITKEGIPKWFLVNMKGIVENGHLVRFWGSQTDITETKIAEDKLKASEARYRRIFETATEGIWSMDRDHRTTFVNQHMLKMLGYQSEDVIGKRVEDFMFEEDLSAHQERMAQRHKNLSGNYEHRFRRSDGTTLWTLVSATVLTDEQGEFDGSFGMFTNITERKLAEDSLHGSEEKFRSLFDAVPVPTYTWQWDGEDFILCDFNEMAVSFTDGNIANLVGIKAKKMYSDNDPVLQDFETCFHQKSIVTREMDYQLKSTGERKFLNVKYAYVAPDLILVLTEDLTDRKRTEDNLNEIEARFRGVFEQSGVSMYITDSDGKMIQANPAFQKLWGLSAEELSDVIANYNILTDQEAIKHGLVPYFQKAFEGEKVSLPQVEFDAKVTVDGMGLENIQTRKCWISPRMYPLKNENDVVTDVVVFEEDITEYKNHEIKIRKSEEKFRSYVSNAPHGIFIADENGRYLEVNKAACDLLGYSEKELTKLGISDISEIEDSSIINNSFQQLKKVGHSRSESKFIRKDGTIGYWDVNAVKLKDNRYLGFTTDITERKLAVDALQASEIRFSTIFHSSPLATALTHLEGGQLVEVNQAWQKVTGYTYNEVIGKTANDLNLYVIPKQRSDMIHEIEKHGKVSDFEFKFRNKSGEIIDLSFSADLIEVEGKNLMLSMALDITERKKAEEKLRESEAKYRAMYDNALVGLFRTGLEDGRVVEANQASAELFGYDSIDEFIEEFKAIDHYVNPDDRISIIKELKEKGSIHRIEVHSKKKNGEKIWNEASYRSNAEEGFLECVSIDVTDRKRAEMIIRSNQETMQNLAKKVITAQEDERKYISRELHDQSGQVLTALNIQLDMISASLPEDLDTIRTQIIDANQLLKTAMKDLRSLAHGLRPPLLDTFGIDVVLKELCHDFGNRINLKIDYQAEEIPVMIKSTKVSLYRFTQEALTNIAKHAQAKHVQVNLYQQDTDVILKIQDDGIGFDSRNTSSLGIGLENMTERLKLVGGKLEINSRLEQGTKLTACIPIADSYIKRREEQS